VSKYARGRKAWGICQRSGQRVLLDRLVRDGHNPGLLVAPEWWEPKHPQEFPPPMDEAIALYRPSPEEAMESSEDFVASPAAPLSSRYLPSGILADTVYAGETVFTTTIPLTWSAGDTIYIELDAGGWFAGEAALDGSGYVLETVQPITGTATAGNDVYITPSGSGVPILALVWNQASLTGTFDTGQSSSSVSVTASNGTAPYVSYVFELIGAAGAGFALVPTSNAVVIDMTNALGGTYSLQLKATVTDTVGDTATASLPVTITVTAFDVQVT